MGLPWKGQSYFTVSGDERSTCLDEKLPLIGKNQLPASLRKIYILSAKHATSYTQVNVLEILFIFILKCKISGRYVGNTKALPVQMKSPLGLVNVFHFILY